MEFTGNRNFALNNMSLNVTEVRMNANKVINVTEVIMTANKVIPEHLVVVR